MQKKQKQSTFLYIFQFIKCFKPHHKNTIHETILWAQDIEAALKLLYINDFHQILFPHGLKLQDLHPFGNIAILHIKQFFICCELEKFNTPYKSLWDFWNDLHFFWSIEYFFFRHIERLTSNYFLVSMICKSCIYHVLHHEILHFFIAPPTPILGHVP